MELAPAEQIKFNQIMDIIRSTYEEFGFAPLDTPALELSEVLLAKAGGETEKQIYRFMRGDTDISMRFDLTVPLARYVVMNQNTLTFPFKRYQIGKVYRGERAQKGRFREFYQADIDVIGMDKLDISYDAEMPAIIYNVFKKLGLSKFVINISNRKLLKGLMESLGLADKSAEVLRIVDKIAKIGKDKVVEELVNIGLDKKSIDTIIRFIEIDGDDKKVFESLQSFGIKNEIFTEGISELTEVINSLTALGVPKNNYKINLTITRGLDYYTGTIYETMLDDYPQFGSICSGGRYDDLAGFYTDKKLPGVGISIGLTRLFASLLENDLIKPTAATPAHVMVVPITNAEKEYALSLGADLRALGIKVLTFTEDNKFKAKLNYANKIGVPFVAIIGEDEVKNRTAVIKDMATGEQQTLSLEDVSMFLINKIMEAVKGKILQS
jgi:histidyl-tRNA synthetase